MKTNPADLDAITARRLIARKILSPVELAQACIERVELINPAVNALIAYNFEQLLVEAKIAEQQVMDGSPLGLLHGLPIGIKDMIDVAGLPTTYGSLIYRDNIAATDDANIIALREAGATILGKTNNPEWSAGANTRNAVYGVTPNPFDLNKTSAGSSGGSAVALATGMCPLATGSDTGGSLRNPAAYCGVVGFRPSPGVVPGHRRDLALVPLPTTGPMARNVDDLGLMLTAMARKDRNDPYTAILDDQLLWKPERFANLAKKDLSSLRIAFTEDFGFAPTEKTIRRKMQQCVHRLEAFTTHLEEATPDCTNADRIFAVLRSLAFLHFPSGLMKSHPDKFGPNVTANVEEGLSYSAQDVADAMRMHSDFYRHWQEFFENYDYIISPAVTISPRDWRELYPKQIDGVATQSYYHWLALAYASTLVGHPSITIPMGLDSNNMPFGLQIIGKRNDDYGVLAVAAEIEAIFADDAEMCRPIPDLEALAKAAPIHLVDDFYGVGA